MFTKLINKAVLITVLCFTGNISAGMIVDTVNPNAYVGYWQSFNYFHDLNDNGFEIGTALSGTLEINVYDDRRNDCFGLCRDQGEVILFTVESFDFDTGTLSFADLDADLGVNALGAINTDGRLDVKVTSLFGDFYVSNSVLTINTAEVTEPASVVLLGLGLIGLGITRRRQV